MDFRSSFAVSLLVVGLGLTLTAQRESLSGTSSKAAKPQPDIPLRMAGSFADNTYRNPSFGFSYKIPFGWVERTTEMREDDSGNQPTDPSQAQVLLAVFERPPEASGETVNSAVVIAAESVKSYPGLKTAVDYFTPLEEVTKAKGFKVANEPYEFSVGTKRLAREDFSKELGKLAMQQASLVMVQKGYVMSFTFIAGSQDEVEELIAGLSFAPILKPNNPLPQNPKSDFSLPVKHSRTSSYGLNSRSKSTPFCVIIKPICRARKC